MSRIRSALNLLVIAIMVSMIAITVIFAYASVHLKNRIILRTVQQTELVSDVMARSAAGLMASGHGRGVYSMLLGYGGIIGVDEVGIYRLNGDEAFLKGEEKAGRGFHKRSIGRSEKETFLKAIESMNPAGFFDREESTFSRYVPLLSDGACLKCHTTEGEVLGVLKIRLSTENDFELLGDMQRLIWILGLIVLLPVGALVVAGAVIREKNKLFGQLKAGNDAIKETYDELNNTRRYLQMILDNSRVIIVTTDTKGRIVEFNREAEALLEYTKAEVAGKDILMLYNDPQKRLGPVNGERQMEGEAWEVRNREVALRSKTGKVCHVIMTLSTMVNDEGRIIGTVGVGKDISEQKMLQFKLMQSEKLAGIGTLASGIAHEINNPLAGILGMAEAIRDEDDMALIKSYTDDIIQYSVNARNIVRELSAYSRSAHNVNEGRVDLASVVDNSLKMARHSASFAGIEIATDLAEACYVQANPVELQQVFVNLIVNAVYAIGGKGTLSIRCWSEGGLAKTKVSDTGEGIPEKNLNQIFDPFFTTKPVGEGTGLGLYVVYRIVTKYGGSVDVESAVGAGTSFTVGFPSASAEEE